MPAGSPPGAVRLLGQPVRRRRLDPVGAGRRRLVGRRLLVHEDPHARPDEPPGRLEVPAVRGPPVLAQHGVPPVRREEARGDGPAPAGPERAGEPAGAHFRAPQAAATGARREGGPARGQRERPRQERLQGEGLRLRVGPARRGAAALVAVPGRLSWRSTVALTRWAARWSSSEACCHCLSRHERDASGRSERLPSRTSQA
mmetsp:Transcript_35216/g.94352  ORF Transcript_35216/g.94352 Transcript_35216/m.94352 type:complete len:201 (+) Transcript_35216:128-730(+)